MDPQLSAKVEETPSASGAPSGAPAAQSTTFAQKDLATATFATSTPTAATSHPPRPSQPLATRQEPQSKDLTTTATARDSTTVPKGQEHLNKVVDVTTNLPTMSNSGISTTSTTHTTSSTSASASMPNSSQFNPTVHRPSLASEAALAAVKAVRENPSKVLSNGGDSHPSKDKDVEMDVEGDETEDEIQTTRRQSVNGHRHDEDADGEAEGDEEDGYEANPTTSGSSGVVGSAGQAPTRSQPPSQHAKRKQGRQRKNTSALPSSSQHASSSSRQQTTPPPSVSSPPLAKDDSPLDGQSVTEEKYRRLKRKLKEVLQENERMATELELSHRRVRNLRKEKNLLLDKIIQYERGHESDSVSELSTSLSSDSESSDASLYSRRSERPWSRHANGGRRDGSSTSSARHLAVATGSAGSGPHHPRKTYKTSRRRSPSASGNIPSAGSSSAAAGAGASAATATNEGDGMDGHRHLSPSASRGGSSSQSALRGKDHKPTPVPSLITNVGSAFQKPKRIHTSAKQRATNMMRVKKVLPLARDENGNVKLPCTIGILTVMSLGKVIWDREAFHNERYIWPVGYKMSRLYNSMIDKTSLTTYTCSVIDDGDAPKFMIEVGDQPGKPIIAGTATGAWTHVVKAANEIRKRDHSNSASGPDYFGFSNPTIAKLIQELADADKCEHYIMQRFEEGTGRSGSAAQAAAGEKRRLGRGSASGSSATGGGGGGGGGGGDDKEGKDGTDGGGGGGGSKNGDHESYKDDMLDEEDDSDYVSLGTAGIKPPPAKKLKVSGATSDHEDDDASMVIDSGDGSGMNKHHHHHSSLGATTMEEDIDIEANDEEEEDHDDEHEEEEIDELDDDDADDDEDEDDVMAPAPPSASSSGPAAPSSSTYTSSSHSPSSSDVKQGPLEPSSHQHHHQAAPSGGSTLASSDKISVHPGKAISVLHQETTPATMTTIANTTLTQEPIHSIATSTSSAADSNSPAVVVASE
ncbi:hypothetical protein DFQ26_003947 [Actinomortierella ambigua]|nr:hypothetical protein DFQ26_003947 [Actinomortierella ambigua]